ncbi:Methyltransf_21 domain-containing protein [Durusdinium trenchii]|uniref:Methyltransf_21 domain-containing protein n=1 Tax=Durusdinium trenchii TaxID=1381693 RepID=A0ABP0K1V7_9DINO
MGCPFWLLVIPFQSAWSRISDEAWYETEDGIFAQVQVAQMPFHKNWAHLPSPPERFWIEVGMNNWGLAVWDGDFGPKDFVIGFEPLLDKYGERLAAYRPITQGTEGTGKRRILGLQHERGMVFPFAVGCKGMVELSVPEEDSCSTILPVDPNSIPDSFEHPMKDVFDYKADCVTAGDKRLVLCISLDYVIRVWLNGHEVEYLKIDAEGADLMVVQSAGAMLSKVKTVSLETRCDELPRPWDSPNCSTILRYMYKEGYFCYTTFREQLVKCGPPNNNICRICGASVIDLTFTRMKR